MEETVEVTLKQQKQKRRWLMLIVIPLWVLASFILAEVIAQAGLYGLNKLGVTFASINEAVISTVFAFIVYALTLLIAIGLPYKLKQIKTNLKDLGLTRSPIWSDLLLAPAGFIVYIILTGILAALAVAYLPWFDATQAQQTGFNQLNTKVEYLLAFFSLVVLAPIAEEIVFRGYLFGKLKKYVPVWAAIIVTSLLFGLVHMSWNVGLDTFALSILLCSLRQISGSLWPSILLHSLKNAIAFYILFINPLVLHTLGG